MNHAMRLLVLPILLGGMVPPLRAQAPAPLVQGVRIRVRTPQDSGVLDRGIEGTVQRLSGDTLVLRPKAGGASQTFLAGESAQLFVYDGHRSRLVRGAAIGGVLGLLTGGLVSAVRGESCYSESTLCVERRVDSFRTEVILGASGIAGGLIIGLFASHEVWARSSRLPSVRPAISVSAHGMGVGLRATF
jgi:hypothetical protein